MKREINIRLQDMERIVATARENADEHFLREQLTLIVDEENNRLDIVQYDENRKYHEAYITIWLK